MTLPNFRLKDANSNYHYSFDDLKGSKGTLVVFLSNNCPFVDHVLPEVLMIAADYRVQGLGIISLCSDAAVADFDKGASSMTEFAFRHSFDFPYLHDSKQEAAKALEAAFSPNFYLFDNQGKLYYHGQLDDARPANGILLSGSDLRNAIDSLIYNRNFTVVQKPGEGCPI